MNSEYVQQLLIIESMDIAKIDFKDVALYHMNGILGKLLADSYFDIDCNVIIDTSVCSIRYIFRKLIS